MIYVTGDTHGDRSRLSKKRLKALNPGDTLIICGDFGFLWNDDRAEQKFLYNLSKRPYNICFADGTHENFDLLYRFPVKEKFGGRVHAVADNIFHKKVNPIFLCDCQQFRIETEIVGKILIRGDTIP